MYAHICERLNCVVFSLKKIILYAHICMSSPIFVLASESKYVTYSNAYLASPVCTVLLLTGHVLESRHAEVFGMSKLSRHIEILGMSKLSRHVTMNDVFKRC